MTYAESIQFLYGLRLFGTKLGLENTLRLAELAGNPHRSSTFIHVAGTNGKGSTCAMLESILRSSRRRVGLFTSPHLVSFRERIQVDRQLISKEEVVRLVAELAGFLQAFPAAHHPTFFEVVTILAMRYFAEQRCDLVVLETGLGGRLDATNIVTPLASVITNVDLDHEKWLGSSVGQIALEKAGIIKPSVPVITAATHPEALRTIRYVAHERGAPLTEVAASDLLLAPLSQIALPLLGDHQRLNAALAVKTLRVLEPQVQVSTLAMIEGLSKVQWAGRLQRLTLPDGRVIVLDGAHNPAGARTLRDALAHHFSGQSLTLILGVMRDKDWEAMCALLAPCAERILLTPVHSERTALPTDLTQACHRINPSAVAIPCSSLAEALGKATRDAVVIVTGSLHLVGEAMELLDLLPGVGAERHLNEWDAAMQRGSSASP